MKIRSVGLAPLLAAWMATAWMATLAMTVAPIADASPTTSFDGAGRTSDSSGDVEINFSHSVHFPPAYPDFGSRGIYHHGHHHH